MMEHKIGRRRIVHLTNMTHIGGACYAVSLPDVPPGDIPDQPQRSNTRLFEGDYEIGPAHAVHEHIAAEGGGAFSHWGQELFFSSSDGTDPRANGRNYLILLGYQEAPVDTEAHGLTPDRGGILRISNFTHVEGLCYSIQLPYLPAGDTTGAIRSSFRLFEGSRELGPNHEEHRQIALLGQGRFSHWRDTLFFSSSDGSDPRQNDRQYQVVFYNGPENARRLLALAAANVNANDLDEEARFTWGEQLFEAFVPRTYVGERSKLYFLDDDFRRDHERFNAGNYRDYDRKYALKELLKLTLPLDGHIAECGVYRGGSAYLLAKASTNGPAGKAKKVQLFDSFSGLSDPDPRLDGDHWSTGDLTCTAETVAGNLKEFGDRIELHRGWVPDCFASVTQETYCFVHIDVDLYAPTRDAVRFFASRMVAGGLIICDDYGFATCPGARRAMDEFSHDSGLPIVELPTGQGLVMFSQPAR